MNYLRSNELHEEINLLAHCLVTFSFFPGAGCENADVGCRQAAELRRGQGREIVTAQPAQLRRA